MHGLQPSLHRGNSETTGHMSYRTPIVSSSETVFKRVVKTYTLRRSGIGEKSQRPSTYTGGKHL